MHTAQLQPLPPAPPGRSGWPWTAPPVAEPQQADTALPRISIVTPSYNQGQFLEEAIRSVLLQGYPNLEYHILDGGSSDESVTIIRRYAPWLTSWVSEPDGGQSAALNRGIARADGQLVGWLNSDDLLLPGALLRVGAYVAANPGCSFLTGDGSFVSPDRAAVEFQKQAAPYTLRDLLFYHCDRYLPQPAVFFARAAFAQVGGLDGQLHYAMDVDLWLRLRAVHTLHYIPATLAQLRRHADAKTWRDNERAMSEAQAVIGRHLGRLGLADRLRVRAGLRAVVARAVCNAGLASHFAQDRAGARRALARASAIWPPSALTPAGRRLALRLALPLWARKLAFHNP